MKSQAVPWQRVLPVLVVVAVGLAGIVVAFRADGFAALDATVPRATRWFVDQAILIEPANMMQGQVHKAGIRCRFSTTAVTSSLD